MAAQQRVVSFESVSSMASYTSSSIESTPSEASPSSPISTPDTFDLEDAPPLHGLGPYSSTHDPTFVLVIGGLGFIGSHTVLELLRAGFNGEYVGVVIWAARQNASFRNQ